MTLSEQSFEQLAPGVDLPIFFCSKISNHLVYTTSILSLFTVNDFEDQLQQKNADMEQQLQLVSDLDVEIKRLQVNYSFD